MWLRQRNCLNKKGEAMPEEKEQNVFAVDPPAHRLDVPLHNLLMKPAEQPSVPPSRGAPQTLPEPVFPRNPKLMNAPDEDFFPKNGVRHYKAEHIYRSMKGWAFPYFRISARACCPVTFIR
jgi:hypothetical protein